MIKPPYEINSQILKLITSISIKIGEVNANYLDRANPQLRKQNKIKTIQSSLAIEGNTLSEEQITAILENKRVIGPKKDIDEVINAIKIYDILNKLNPSSEKDFLYAHKILMDGLIENSGSYRNSGVGIVKGNKVKHLAPPSQLVKSQMQNLFSYIKKSNELTLIKSCVFHYEMEFIHPFLDGNGRMGRLWQTLILMQEYPLFEYLPFETLISENQIEYYNKLEESDKSGDSTAFIEFMLKIIDISLNDMLTFNVKKLTALERLNYFLNLNFSNFSRSDYIKVFPHISTATASRDLKLGIKKDIISKNGDKNKTIYNKK
jgi:Fic family protein